MRRLLPALIAICVVGLTCASPPHWRADDYPSDRDAALLLTEGGASGNIAFVSPSEIPEVPVRTHLRPCCAFGAQLGVKIGPVPIPGYRIGNIIAPEDVGHHVYDSGVVEVGSRVDDTGLVHSEHNGLIYTCSGGFIDTAHVRDYADWTIFLVSNVARNLEHGFQIRLPDEGGVRQITVRPIAPDVAAKIGPRTLALGIGQWLAFQLSIWHEAATWFGWSTSPAFSEKLSAFSPEDLYSNMIGTRIAAAIASQRNARDEFLYNRSVDRWMERMLSYLGGVSVELGEEAMRSVDGLWWNSAARIPDSALVLRRNLEVGAILNPWLVPTERMTPGLLARCGPRALPFPIANADSIDGRPFSEFASLEIQVDDSIAKLEPFASKGGRITDRDFPTILAHVREEIRGELGDSADRAQ